MPQKYTIDVTFKGQVPKAWMRSWLDDMFSDEAIRSIRDVDSFSISRARFVCRDCEALHNGDETGFITECPECGGGLSAVIVSHCPSQEPPGEVETAELNTETPD